jgi:Rieske Fe-S protein
MKIKFLAVLGLATVAGLAGCKGAANTNTAVTNTTTTSTTNTNIAMSTPMSTPMATKDAAAETAVKAALDKAGIKGVTAEATTAVVTLRGTVAKGKMSEAVQIATEAGKRKVDNQLTEMK